MHNTTISPTETIIFGIPILIWGLLLYGGFIFGKIDDKEKRRMPLWTRLTSSLTLVIIAWIWFISQRGTDIEQLALWLAIGMTLSFLGDIFMADILPLQPYVLYGILAFGVGHIAYIIGFSNIGLQLDSNFPNFVVLIIWWLIGIVGWFFLVFWKTKREFLHYAALPYALLLASTVGVATTIALGSPAFVIIAIGAALFLLSDLILAAELFSNLHFKLIGDVIWLTYGTGQMLIICGLILYTLVAST